MNRDALQSPTALQVARGLVAREFVQGQEGKAESVAAALQRGCTRLSRNLRDSLGEDGWTALLARALARTEADHPALKNIRPLIEGGLDLDAVIAGIETHGLANVTAAIEALLAALIDILGRLIGEDMAIALIEQDSPRSRPSGGEQAQ